MKVILIAHYFASFKRPEVIDSFSKSVRDFYFRNAKTLSKIVQYVSEYLRQKRLVRTETIVKFVYMGGTIHCS